MVLPDAVLLSHGLLAVAYLSVENGYLLNQTVSPWRAEPETFSAPGPAWAKHRTHWLAKEASPQTRKRVGTEGWQSTSVKGSQEKGLCL